MSRLWMRLLLRVSHPGDRTMIEADAREEFARRSREEGEPAARRWLRGQACSAIIPGIRERWRRRGRGIASPDDLTSGAPTLLADLGRDTLLALRSLRRSPGLVALVVGSLGVGIGGTSVVFSMARSLLYPDAGPIAEPERVVTVYESDPQGTAWRQVAHPNVEDMRREVPALAGVAAARLGVVSLGEDAGAERAIVEIVSGNYFEVLGLPTTLGRSFSAEETVLGSAEPLFILSYEAWQRRFGGDPAILGETLLLEGRPHTVIGVGAPGVSSRMLQLQVMGWVPLGIPGGTWNANEAELTNRADREYHVMARLAPGASIEQAQAQLDGLAVGLEQTFPEIWRDDRGDARFFSVLPERESRLPPDFRPVGLAVFGLLLAGALLILAIACMNVAGLLLARAQRRLAEVAIRISIGAGGGRIVRMLLTESLMLALAGGSIGVLLTWLFVQRGAAIPLPGALPDLSFSLSIDVPVLLFTLGVATASALLFGLAPALQAVRGGGGLTRGMRGGSRASRGRRLLVSVQVAGSVVLLMATGLLLRSVGASQAMESGLDISRVAVMSWQRDADARALGTLEALRTEIESTANISEVALASAAEVSPFFDLTSARILLPEQDEPVVVPFNAVSPNYAAMVDLQVRRGRWLEESDRVGGIPAVVVNERFAEVYLDRDPIGKSFTIEEWRNVSTPASMEAIRVQVVGVAEDVRNSLMQPPAPYFWSSIYQFDAPNPVLHVRGPAGPAAAAVELRRLGGGRLTLVGPSTYDELAATNAFGQEAFAPLLAAGAGFALVLAIVGLGGLLSVSVAMRLPGLSIRRALGASRSDVILDVIAESGRRTAWGLLLGLGLSIPAGFLARSVLPGVSPVDPVTLVGTIALLSACALGTALPAALRAANADPLHHLRNE